MNAYTSEITDCDHITGENASTRAADTALANTSRLTAGLLVRCRNPTRCPITWPVLEITSATRPIAAAPNTTDIRFTRQAMLPNGISFCQAQARMVQIGYPGGCGTPR